MTQGIVLKSLEELGQFSDLITPANDAGECRALVPVEVMPWVEPSIEELADEASRAAQELREVAEADRRARQDAEQALDRYRRLQREKARLEAIITTAQGVADKAAALAEFAFEVACAQRAREVAGVAAQVSTVAGSRRATVEAELSILASRGDIARLLAEERAREEEARRETEERRRQARLSEGIARAEALAKEGRVNEAARLLGALARAHPSSPDLASCIDRVRRQQWAVKTFEIEKAVREARRLTRRQPREAAAALEPLDLSDMPDVLTRQAYGCWLAACRRLGLENALHYRAAFGKGAVLVPTGDDGVEVVSAVGLQRWRPGRRFSRAALKGARRLD